MTQLDTRRLDTIWCQLRFNCGQLGFRYLVTPPRSEAKFTKMIVGKAGKAVTERLDQAENVRHTICSAKNPQRQFLNISLIESELIQLLTRDTMWTQSILFLQFPELNLCKAINYRVLVPPQVASLTLTDSFLALVCVSVVDPWALLDDVWPLPPRVHPVDQVRRPPLASHRGGHPGAAGGREGWLGQGQEAARSRRQVLQRRRIVRRDLSESQIEELYY